MEEEWISSPPWVMQTHDWKKQRQSRFLTDEINRRDEALSWRRLVEQKQESAAAGLQEADLGNRSPQPLDSIATAGPRRYYGDDL